MTLEMVSDLHDGRAPLRASTAAAAVEMMGDVISVTHPARFVAWRAMPSHTKVVSVAMGEGEIIKSIPFDWSKA
jgi:hypothetical protein